jgi:uncharacterized protein YigE (DUF2233 family)
MNVLYRNSIGILPNGNILFIRSKVKMNFYNFAAFFKNKKYKNTLHSDGFVSKTYLLAKGAKGLDRNFGVIIGEIQ